ncbi:adenylate/guanylate cyclase domain-containing protein [Spirochaetia bacterium]|nr:adenylate/guanylate cyclase domain-containing protein [Spirochaetia bacterium]
MSNERQEPAVKPAIKPAAVKIKFPISFKLVFIVTTILLLSLGLITSLVSFMVSRDVRLSAEDTNFTINKQMAAMADTILSMTQSNTFMLIHSMENNDVSLQENDFFFEQNKNIAALARVRPGSANGPFVIINEQFFLSNGIDFSLVQGFVSSEGERISRAAGGETMVLNVSPLAGIPLLAMLFPREGEAVAVFFSADTIAQTFGTGSNTTFMINDDGDILVHSDTEFMRSGANIINDPIVVLAQNSGKTFMQTLYTAANGRRYFGAFSSLPSMGIEVITRIEENLILEGVAATTRRNIFLTGAVLFLAIMLTWFFSKSISGPVKLLAAAAGRIKEGQFEIDIPVKSKDEIGFLTSSFTEMGRGLAERERLKDTFGRFTNAAIAEQAMRGELSLGGENKPVTIFFSDIRSFTAISEKLAAAEVVEFLNDYLTSMVECVEKTGGVVDKFIGDSVMAVWGAPLSAGSAAQDAYNCVYSALLMRSALIKFNHDRGGDRKPLIKIGCGINSGDVIAGQIGSNRRMEYTVIGDPVNLASRSESLNKPLGTDILITENTWTLVRDQFITEEMPSVTVKGKEKPVRLFAVINLKYPTEAEQEKPVTLAELRQLLEISAVDLGAVDVNAEETKYKIQS